MIGECGTIGREEGRDKVPFQMVNGRKGDVQSAGQRFGRLKSDKERSGKTRSLGGAYAFDGVPGAAALGPCGGDDLRKPFEMSACSHFWDDTSPRLVERNLTAYDMGMDDSPILDDRGRRFITRGLDSQPDHRLP